MRGDTMEHKVANGPAVLEGVNFFVSLKLEVPFSWN